MAKSVHVCSECGHESAKWHGRCPGCDEWNTLVEQRAATGTTAKRSRGGKRAATGPRPVALAEIKASAHARLKTGLAELDRVLGGGLVPGSVVLLGGAPGIGKSTLSAARAGRPRRRRRSGSTSAARSPLRRCGCALSASARTPRRADPAETDLEAVIATIEAESPDVCVVDSVQTLRAPGLTAHRDRSARCARSPTG